METCEILIIGAGASGLMAGYKLSEQGKKVIILEARNRNGGRIHTIQNELFFKHAELGAEFIHGDLPVTLNLLKEAGIAYSPAGGSMVRCIDDDFAKDEPFIKEWGLLMEKLNELKTDINLTAFLQQYFPGEKYKKLRNSVYSYVSGYDTADPDLASAFALRKEWQNEDEDAQHRIDNGYCGLISFLEGKIKSYGGTIYLNSVVSKAEWKPGNVKATTAPGLSYSAGKLLIAVPLGVLQAEKGETGAIDFHPPIIKQTAALNAMGFGAIIKFLMEFDEIFWENEVITQLAGESLSDMGFLFSNEAIPTWWTQAPEHSPVLTGWLGGMPATEKKELSDEALLQIALQSLSNIFKMGVTDLKAKLVAWNVVNWTTDPFTRGSYSYDTITTPQARKLLSEPVDDTLYFAGEYLHGGAVMGTVEAALISGIDAAEEMMS